MKLSHYLLPTLRESPSEAEVISHQLMLRAGMIKKIAAGIFTYLPLGYQALKKIENIIREEMNRTGAQELLMPVLQPAELWKESGRWNAMADVMVKLKDKNEREFCLGPTHEEVVTDIARHFVRSYKQLPLTLYQIQTKFRDEIRPRFGLMRGREFLMKDAYSFHATKEDAEKEYHRMKEAYERIFKRCGLEFRAVEADTGAIGGSLSHEFQVLAQSGEDEILSCESCSYAANRELIEKKGVKLCPGCGKGKMKSYRGIEVGHIFYLGKKYSEALSATFLNEKGESHPFEMGCYGIGVGRTMAAAIEQNHDVDGIIWPISIAPFEIVVVPLNMSDSHIVDEAQKIYNFLLEKKVSVLFYDKEERAGVKFKDADLIGIPVRVTIGSQGLKEGKGDIKIRNEKTEMKVSLQGLPQKILEIREELYRKINSRT